MIFTLSSEGHQDRDEVWVVPLEKLEALAPLLEEPRVEIAAIEIAQAQALRGPIPADQLKELVFNPKLPLLFLFSFSPDTQGYLVQGVDTTNVVNVYVPGVRLSELTGTAITPYPEIKTDTRGERPVDIKFIQGLTGAQSETNGIAYVHFDPVMGKLASGQDNPVPLLLNLLRNPGSFTQWLDGLASSYVQTFENLNGEVRAFTDPVRFQFPDDLRQLRVVYQQNYEGTPCYPVGPNGLCIKGSGIYSQQDDGSYTFLLSEVNLIPYCPPDTSQV